MRASDVPIEAPCDEDWDRMRSASGGCRRRCDRCAEDVHDLSAMSEAEARVFLDATADRDVCIAYTHDERGVIRFAEPAPLVPLVPLARVRRRPSPLTEAAKLASAASVAALLSACTPHDRGETPAVVSDPIEQAAEPMIVIPPSDGPAHAASDGPKPDDAEPCEPSPPAPRALPKKGKRKRVGMRVRPHPNTDPLG
jgi:hypothetical protein